MLSPRCIDRVESQFDALFVYPFNQVNKEKILGSQEKNYEKKEIVKKKLSRI
jgi:hypothetical protein